MQSVSPSHIKVITTQKPCYDNKDWMMAAQYLKENIKGEEDVCLMTCCNYAVQGDWLNIDAVVKTDLPLSPTCQPLSTAVSAGSEYA